MRLEATYRLGTAYEGVIKIDDAGWIYDYEDLATERRDWGGKGNAQRLYWLMSGSEVLGRVDIQEE